MNKKETLPSYARRWLSAEAEYDFYFNVGPQLSSCEHIGTFKVFLRAHSETLRDLLHDDTVNSLHISDVKPEAVRLLLKSLYLNCVNITGNQLSFENCVDVLNVSYKYKVHYVTDLVGQNLLYKLKKKHQLQDFFYGLSSLAFIKQRRLLDICSKIVKTNRTQILSSLTFLNLCSEAVLFILSLDNEGTDIEYWNAILKWARIKKLSNSSTALREQLADCLKYIQFHNMRPDDFLGSVVPTQVLTDQEVIEICKAIGLNEVPKVEFFSATNWIRQTKLPDRLTIGFCINNIDEFCGTSKSFKFQEADWTLDFKKSQIGLGVHFKFHTLLHRFRRRFMVHMILVNQKDKNYLYYFNHYFVKGPGDHGWGVDHPITWGDKSDPSYNVVDDDNCITVAAYLVAAK